MKAFAPAFILFLSLTLSVAAQGLSKTEKKISTIVSTNTPEAIEFLERVVNINSGSLNLKGVREVGAVFREGFDAIGFETEWEEMPAEMNRAGHLIATIKGDKGKKLLLIGHLDTVFEENSPFQTFKKLNDSIALAPGGNDMKGGDVMILYALKALYEAGALEGADIQVVFTGDEESTGKPLEISRASLISAAKRADIALGYETSTGFDYATVARRGASGWHLVTEGRRAHSSGVFSERTGAGAIFEMSRILNAFYEQVRGEEFLTFNPGILYGGTFMDYDPKTGEAEVFGKTNVVAQKAEVRGGLRFITEDQKERAREAMRAIVGTGNLPQTSAKIEFTDSYPAMPPTAGNLALLEQLSKVSNDLGQGPVEAYDPGRRGAADISFAAAHVEAALGGLGSMGSGAHTPSETVNLKTFEALTQRTAILIYRLINQ
ncbi:MAG: M20/M25/M40 family metallo-hydrolase [Bacteroidetes bacterium]|nr:M20/M25/M40 family metallo-hydrolase [Bacteroidota bacterium]